MWLIPVSAPARQFQALRPQIEAAVSRVLISGVWLNGPETEAFTEEFARWCGAEHCIAVANGTDALELSLRVLGVGIGDEVITVANAGGYAATACRLIGAVPVWVDVLPDTLGMDPNSVRLALSPKTKVVVATHLFGIAVDVEAVRGVLAESGRRDIAILEDCAQAHGAVRGGKRVGSLGDIAAFSFYPTKNLGALGDAGAIVTNHGRLAERAMRLRQYGWTRKYVSDERYGRNSRMDEIQAAVLRVKLPYVDQWNTRRREVLARYASEIREPNRIVGRDDPTRVERRGKPHQLKIQTSTM